MGSQRLARWVGVDPVALDWPQPLALESPEMARLQCLTDLVVLLRATYIEAAVARWFDRPRQRLQGRSPSQILATEWSPSDPVIRTLFDVAVQ